MATSHFTFTFRVSPSHYCHHLHFDNKQLASGFGAVWVRDYLVIIWVGELEHNESARGLAHHLARTLIQSHAYFSFPDGSILDIEPVTWLEVRDCELKTTVFGYMHPDLQTAPLREGHEDNNALIRAVDLVPRLINYGSLQIALADFHSARKEHGPYSAFYAYRVLEDVGFSFGIRDDHPDWDAMNAALKTSKEKWKPLIDAGTRARHLSEQNVHELARVNPRELLALSREALTLAFVHFGIITG
jgi:hypothetical protein